MSRPTRTFCAALPATSMTMVNSDRAIWRIILPVHALAFIRQGMMHPHHRLIRYHVLVEFAWRSCSVDWSILWWVLAALIVIAGLVGTVVPALPGVPLVFAGLFIGAWIDDFTTVGWATVGILAALAFLGWIVDFVASAVGARYLGASSRAFWGATAGAVVGIFFGVPGMLLGPFLGAVLGELSGGRGLVRSGRAGLGAWLGMVLATAAKLAIAFLMIGLFVFRIGFGQIAVNG